MPIPYQFGKVIFNKIARCKNALDAVETQYGATGANMVELHTALNDALNYSYNQGMHAENPQQFTGGTNKS